MVDAHEILLGEQLEAWLILWHVATPLLIGQGLLLAAAVLVTELPQSAKRLRGISSPVLIKMQAVRTHNLTVFQLCSLTL